MDKAVDALFDLDKSAEIGHVADSALHHRADAVTRLDGGPGIRFQLLEAERDAAIAWIHVENHGLHLIARLDDLRGMLHAPRPRHLGDVDEAFDSGFEFHECTVVGDVDDAADHTAVHGETFRHSLPRIGLELLDS